MGNFLLKTRGLDMTKNQIFKFINRHSVFDIATSENGMPHVRSMILYRANEDGLIFSTRTSKDLYKQLSENPCVELCFYSGIEKRQVRISGTVEQVEDVGLKKEIIGRYPYLKPWIKEQGYEALAVYCLKHGRATVWTIANNLAPKVYIDL